MFFLLCVLAFAAPKSAPKSPDQAAYDKAKAAYDEVQYGEAIGVLDGLLAKSELTPILRTKATLLIGFCHVGLGNIEAAERRFREVFAADLDTKLPPGTSPKIKDQFERVRTLVLREKVAEAEKAKTAPPVDRPRETPAHTDKPKITEQPRVIEQPKPAPVIAEQKPVAVAPETPVYKKWWFWTVIVGSVAVAGAAVATKVVLVDRNQRRPGTLDVGFEFAR